MGGRVAYPKGAKPHMVKLRTFLLPPLDKLLPFGIPVQVPPKNVIRAGWRLQGNVQQFHMDFPQLAATFAVVAARAGRHYIRPDMLPAQVFG